MKTYINIIYKIIRNRKSTNSFFFNFVAFKLGRYKYLCSLCMARKNQGVIFFPVFGRGRGPSDNRVGIVFHFRYLGYYWFDFHCINLKKTLRNVPLCKIKVAQLKTSFKNNTFSSSLDFQVNLNL